MTTAASDYTKMTSAQRIAFLRSLPRTTVQEADAPRCQCHTFSMWRSGGAWRCLTCDPPRLCARSFPGAWYEMPRSADGWGRTASDEPADARRLPLDAATGRPLNR